MSTTSQRRPAPTRALRRRSRALTQALGIAGVVVGVATLAALPDFVQGGSELDASFGTSKNIWIERDTLRSLPTSGGAWERLAADARGDWGTPDIANQDSSHDVLTLAGALYAVRMNDTAMRTRVVGAIEGAIDTERGGRTLALARNLTGYVLAADLIGYDSPRFHAWLDATRTEDLEGRTLISTHEDRPNNWGSHAGAARVAAARFLGDSADLARAAAVFRGFLGDRAAYADFRFGDAEWQADSSAPVPINPLGSSKNGVNVDGAIVDDIRRCECPVASPAPKENYQWEGMQGIVTQAQLLRNAGYGDVWQWSDAAIARAVDFLYRQAEFPAEGDDTFLTFLIDANLGTSYSIGSDGRHGKSIGYTGWTHSTSGTSSTTTTTMPITTIPPATTTTTIPVITLPPTTTTTTTTIPVITLPPTTTTTTIPVITLPPTTTTTTPTTTTTTPPPPPDVIASRASESDLVAGEVIGSYQDTWSRGDGGHTVMERKFTGRGRPFDMAELRWTIPAIGGTQVLDLAMTVGPDGGDADAGFAVEWSSNGSDWTRIAIVVSETTLDLAVPIGSVSSDVHVRVVDSDRSRGESRPDWVSVDFLQIRPAD